jgi:DNA-binding GntR family transcriptional regulator
VSTRAPGRPRDELNLDGLQPITEPVERGGLKHLVQQSLRRAILSGSLPAGSPLRETQVAEALGVSRVPLREALALLEQEGLVERRPNHGA